MTTPINQFDDHYNVHFRSRQGTSDNFGVQMRETAQARLNGKIAPLTARVNPIIARVGLVVCPIQPTRLAPLAKRKGMKGYIMGQDWSRFFVHLCDVTCPSEAARMYGWNSRTVLRWCNEGKVPAVKIDGRWIISMRYLVEVYGQPPHVDKALDIANE